MSRIIAVFRRHYSRTDSSTWLISWIEQAASAVQRSYL